MIEQAIALCRDGFVKPWEGCAKKLPDGRCTAYPDPGSGDKPWTIWWGTTGPDVQPGTVWDEAQGTQRLDAHLWHFATGLLNLSPNLAKATPLRFAAVLSWAYNCGLGNYRISTFKKRIDAGDWAGAAQECLKWDKAAGRVLRGLTLRRQAEAKAMG